MSNTVISFPIPPYQNVPIEPQFFQPSQFVISDVTLGQTTIVTTAINHNYDLGQLIRLLFPSKYGCGLLNEQTGYVISIPALDEVEVTINSTNSDPFIPSPTFLPFQSKTAPQIVAVGEINTGAINSNGNRSTSISIPGSFQNISPI